MTRTMMKKRTAHTGELILNIERPRPDQDRARNQIATK